MNEKFTRILSLVTCIAFIAPSSAQAAWWWPTFGKGKQQEADAFAAAKKYLENPQAEKPNGPQAEGNNGQNSDDDDECIVEDVSKKELDEIVARKLFSENYQEANPTASHKEIWNKWLEEEAKEKSKVQAPTCADETAREQNQIEDLKAQIQITGNAQIKKDLIAELKHLKKQPFPEPKNGKAESEAKNCKPTNAEANQSDDKTNTHWWKNNRTLIIGGGAALAAALAAELGVRYARYRKSHPDDPINFFKFIPKHFAGFANIIAKAAKGNFKALAQLRAYPATVVTIAGAIFYTGRLSLHPQQAYSLTRSPHD
ncbi:hypothetical protein HOD08_03830 [bacterium]|jgi:hypothetical protein|nr:hypothetical protein [bacterium]